MLDFVWLTGFDRVLPGGFYIREVSRMDGIDGAPLLQFFERPAEVLEDLAVDMLDLARRRHDRDQGGNGLHDQARVALAVLKILMLIARSIAMLATLVKRAMRSLSATDSEVPDSRR